VTSPDSDCTPDVLTRKFAGIHSRVAEDLRDCMYHMSDTEAVRHLFRVASGLDSMLLGEAEILGQVREAYRRAMEGRMTGHILNRLFQGALEVGKRVRSQTEIGTRPMSVAFAGVKLAERIFGNLRAHTALIIGAGKMGEQAVDHMRRRNIRRILVANRSRERAAELARRMDGEAVEWEQLAALLEQPDIVLTSVGGSDRVITSAMLERAMAARENRALFLIDLGVPRNVEPSASELYNVYLYNVDDLTGIVAQNRRARQSEIPRAEAIVGEHVARFEEWHANMLTTVLLRGLRERLEHEREAFLRERLGALEHLSAEDRARAERLSRTVLEQVISVPEERLRAGRGGEWEVARALVSLAREKP
ncbi:MAG TPA: glutamyl-tRNA reductase, partial [Candidatus Acidoferrales bacterium]